MKDVVKRTVTVRKILINVVFNLKTGYLDMVVVMQIYANNIWILL